MAVKTLPQKRKEFMSYLTKVMDILDPTGENSKRYHEELDALTDKDFNKWVTDFFEDENDNFYFEIIEFERMLDMNKLNKCAEFMKVPLFERVALPYASDGEDIVVTPEPVPVGYIHEKRMPQTLLKKSAGSISIDKRSATSGQVTGKDKNARNSDAETYSLAAMGAEYALKELMGPRADDMRAKAQFYNEIAKNGYVSLEDIDSDKSSKVALNTLDVYFAMQGIRTNLVDSMDIIPSPKE